MTSGQLGLDGEIDLAGFDLLDPTTQQCPHPHYARMREVAPVLATRAGDLPVWLVTRYDMILDIVRDTETYSSQFGGAAIPADPELAARLRQMRDDAGAWQAVGTLLTADPPAHTRFRKLVSKAFTARAIADLEPVIRDICQRLIASFIDDGRIELMARFAVPLPVEVIAHALAVPPDRLADFKRWSDDAVAAIGASLTPEQRCEAELGIIELQHYFAEQLERRRIEPGSDVLSNLVHARIDSDEDPDIPDAPLSMPEMLSILQQLLVAGNETTTKLLTEMMRLLGEHPDRWSELRADPSRAKDVVEECLRISTPSQAMWRIATRDVVLDGVPIPAGGRVVVMYSSANRDETVFADGDTFDPDRPNLGSHLAFGKGIHFCVGAALSRLEARIALEELTAAIASFTLAETNTFTYLPSFMLRGLTRLDLDVVPA